MLVTDTVKFFTLVSAPFYVSESQTRNQLSVAKDTNTHSLGLFLIAVSHRSAFFLSGCTICNTWDDACVPMF